MLATTTTTAAATTTITTTTVATATATISTTTSTTTTTAADATATPTTAPAKLLLLLLTSVVFCDYGNCGHNYEISVRALTILESDKSNKRCGGDSSPFRKLRRSHGPSLQITSITSPRRRRTPRDVVEAQPRKMFWPSF